MKFFFILLFALVFVLHIPAKKAIVFPELMNPKYLIVEDGKLFVSDYPYIFIYSLKDFKQFKKVGGVGRGPGDFYIRLENMNLKTRGLFISKFQGHLAVCSEHKMSLFDLNGNLLKIIKTPSNINAKYVSLGDKLLCLYPNIMKGKLKVFISDFKFESKNIVYEGDYWAHIGGGKRQNFFDRAGDTLLHAVGGQKIFLIRGDSPELMITRLDFNGISLPPMKQSPEKIKIPENFPDRICEYYKIKFNTSVADIVFKKLDLPEYYPAVRNMFATDQKLFVITYKTTNGLTDVLIFSVEGKYLGKTKLPVKERNLEFIAPSWFSNDTFYQLVENEKNEDWELFVTPIK